MIAALGSLLRWSLFIAALAVGAHFMTLYYLPGILMARAIDNVARGVGYNKMAFLPRSDASTRLMARPDPDVLISACVFNLAQNRLLIETPVPSRDWSLTIYDEDARPFYFLGNETEPGGTLKALLVEPGGAPPAAPDTLRIQSPSFNGIILIRTLIDNEASLAESDRVRHQASCRAVPR